jgi:hypothetical protein
VVGAGASYEVGLPIGSGLTTNIESLLGYGRDGGFNPQRGDETIMYAINELSRADNSTNAYLIACERIRRGMSQAQSIDNFIDSNRSDTKIAVCGKLAIASAILNAERASKLWSDHMKAQSRIDFAAINQSWFRRFFDMLVENVFSKLRSYALTMIAASNTF